MPTDYTPSTTTFHSGPITIPVDGDDQTMVTVGPPIEAALDNAAYCQARLGSSRLADLQSTAGPSGTGSWSTANSSTYTSITSPLLSAGIATEVGDVIEIEVTGAILVSNGSLTAYSAYVKLQDEQNGGSATDVPGTVGGIESGLLQNASDVTTIIVPITVRGFRTITTAGTYQVNLLGATSSGTTTGQFVFAISASMKIWRAN